MLRWLTRWFTGREHPVGEAVQPTPDAAERRTDSAAPVGTPQSGASSLDGGSCDGSGGGDSSGGGGDGGGGGGSGGG